jgi:hypothetical protein
MEYIDAFFITFFIFCGGYMLWHWSAALYKTFILKNASARDRELAWQGILVISFIFVSLTVYGIGNIW